MLAPKIFGVIRHGHSVPTDNGPLTAIGVHQSHTFRSWIGEVIEAGQASGTLMAASPTKRTSQMAQILGISGCNVIKLLPSLEISPNAQTFGCAETAIEEIYDLWCEGNYHNLMVVGHDQGTRTDFLESLARRFGVTLHSGNLQPRKLAMGCALIGYAETGHIELFGEYAKNP